MLAEQSTWGMEIASFGEGFHYFVYSMRKGARKASDTPSHFAETEKDTAIEESRCTGQAIESTTHEHMDSADYMLRMDL